MKKRLEKLDERMLNLNRNLSALIHIQKIKTKDEAEQFLIKINQEIAKWIKEVREIHESLRNEVEENKKLDEVWKEIVETCNDGDPQYSYELFRGTIKDAIGGKK